MSDEQDLNAGGPNNCVNCDAIFFRSHRPKAISATLIIGAAYWCLRFTGKV